MSIKQRIRTLESSNHAHKARRAHILSVTLKELHLYSQIESEFRRAPVVYTEPKSDFRIPPIVYRELESDFRRVPLVYREPKE